MSTQPSPNPSVAAPSATSHLSVVVSPVASRRLLAAALAGLLGVTVQACSDTEHSSANQASGSITLSKVDADMTLEKMTTLCDEKGGTIEQHPHCGGANSCKGMSYDETTEVYTEHTCRGMNTCAGYSCVLP